ncbi:MAG: 2-amino-4-hydroxy-6-hydroxymethyldihydropteridine diphosphokinase [Planctomycetota bacterium]|jgi:2-amino-4-hydroxy-6-hydroxymethyldihydropteridine diphosphokinase|nr:2-amino-4-hydroxy-6-hydroxymethyldihydropteridine diphosphokinase [Planctomycetota bacterium]
MHYALAVGSNRGDRRGFIARAASALVADGRVELVAQSRLIENPAVGGPSGQQDFLNGMWLVDTALGPHQLLMRLQRIESALGRVRVISNGPRTIDLDLIMSADGQVISTVLLELPHPRMCERPFVLEPLAEVAPRWQHPITGLNVEDMWQQLRDAS